MSNIAKSILELIGRTPLVEFNSLSHTNARLLAKLECFNPGGSAKDRAVLFMIEEAEEHGLLKKGSTIIEPTSGNTGIALSWIAAIKGYRVILTMPETMSEERRNLFRSFGAELVLTEGRLGMQGAINKAEELISRTAGSFTLRQFENPANPNAHRSTTGPEIWEDTDGQVDIFISAVGTGGTLSGVADYLKSLNPLMHAIAVEPSSSPVLSGGDPAPHKIQGIGAGFIPKTLYTDLYDEVMLVSDEDAFSTCRMLAAKEGLLVGISSGAAMHCAIKAANRESNKGKTIVVVLPDSGERYLSSSLFYDW